MGESDRTMTEGNALASKLTVRHEWLRAALGYAVAFACLVWVFHDFDLADFLRRVAAMNLAWVGAAILCDVLSYVSQGARWRLLLRPLGRISLLHSTQAVYVGLFVNEVLPMKFGEVVRAVLVSRWMSVKLGSVAASILVERLCDGLWLVIVITLAVLVVPLPRSVVEAGEAFGVVIIIASMFLALLAVRGRPFAPDDFGHAENMFDSGTDTHSASAGEPVTSTSLRERLFNAPARLLRRLSCDLRIIGRARGARWALAFSAVTLLLQMLSFWLVMRAYGLHISFSIGIVVFLIVHLGTMFPNAPANIGTYQFFTVLGLTLFGVDKTAAAGFSLTVFTLLTVPLWAIGVWAFGRSGLTLFQVRSGYTPPSTINVNDRPMGTIRKE